MGVLANLQAYQSDGVYLSNIGKSYTGQRYFVIGTKWVTELNGSE